MIINFFTKEIMYCQLGEIELVLRALCIPLGDIKKALKQLKFNPLFSLFFL